MCNVKTKTTVLTFASLTSFIISFILFLFVTWDGVFLIGIFLDLVINSICILLMFKLYHNTYDRLCGFCHRKMSGHQNKNLSFFTCV